MWGAMVCAVCCLDMVSLGVVGCELCPVVKGFYGRTWHGVHALSNLTLIM